MRIGIDASSAVLEHKTGVAKYIIRLIEHLEDLDSENEYVVLYHLPRIFYRPGRWEKRRYFYRPKKETTKVQVFQEPLCIGRGIDLFHGADGHVPRFHRPKLVATIHDVYPLISHEISTGKYRQKKKRHYSRVARRADKIICVSESTRRDFVRFFPEAEPKISVIYEGVDEPFYPRSAAEVDRVKKKYGLHSDYILYIGWITKRKNVLRMFEAFRHAQGQLDEDLQFLAAGRLSYGWEEIEKYLQDNRLQNRILLPGYIPDEDLPALYTGARLFLFTTLHEGFGLPILEALSCGTPVLTSNVSAMNEVVSELTCRVCPTSSEEIAEKIIEILQKDATNESKPKRNLLAGSDYSWETMAKRILDVYRSI